MMIDAKFSIVDDGTIIEKKNFERILKIFQASAPLDELESTGTGHTVTKKIMELYNDKM